MVMCTTKNPWSLSLRVGHNPDYGLLYVVLSPWLWRKRCKAKFTHSSTITKDLLRTMFHGKFYDHHNTDICIYFLTFLIWYSTLSFVIINEIFWIHLIVWIAAVVHIDKKKIVENKEKKTLNKCWFKLRRWTNVKPALIQRLASCKSNPFRAKDDYRRFNLLYY